MRRLEAKDCTPVMNYVNDSACYGRVLTTPGGGAPRLRTLDWATMNIPLDPRKGWPAKRGE